MGDQSKGNKLSPFNLQNVPPTVSTGKRYSTWIIDWFVKSCTCILTIVLIYTCPLTLFVWLFLYQASHSGLILTFLGGFEGSADVLHLPNCGAGDGQDMEATYPKKTKVLQC